jgi:hypothetical protein
MATRRILLCQFDDGEVKLTRDGIAVMLGIGVEELAERWDPTTGMEGLPADLKRKAQKRATTAKNAMGSNVGTYAIAYWAQIELGGRIDFDEAAGQMWAVLDEP